VASGVRVVRVGGPEGAVDGRGTTGDRATARGAAALLFAALLVACGGSSAPAPTLLSRPASAYLLTLDQLRTPGFTVSEGVHRVEAVPAHVVDSATVRYFREVPTLATANGPVDVRATAYRCDSVGAAQSAFATLTRQADAVPSMLPESAGVLGDEAHADQLSSTSSEGVSLVEVTVTWRTANVVRVLVVRGREGGTGLSDALVLARNSL
jgi:hypothetical protein